MRLEADPTRLEQVVANLLNNAAKYTEPGGASCWIGAEREGGEAVVRVRDTGIGIPPEMLPPRLRACSARQSDRSLDRSQGGLGIGLTLVRSLVEMHGGTVEAHSEGPARAASSSCGCRAQAPAGKAPAAMPEPEHGPSAPAACACSSWTTTWTPPRAWPCCCGSGATRCGWPTTGRRRSTRRASSTPEVVLLDIGLPGMDGYEVARRLRDDPGLDGASCVALTGYGQEEDRRRSREAGIDHHLVKPVEPFVLRTLLANLGAPVASGAY